MLRLSACRPRGRQPNDAPARVIDAAGAPYLDLTEEMLRAEIDVRFASGDMIPGMQTANK